MTGKICYGNVLNWQANSKYLYFILLRDNIFVCRSIVEYYNTYLLAYVRFVRTAFDTILLSIMPIVAWATRSCGSPSACASEHSSCGLIAASAGQRSRRMAITVWLVVAALAGIGATLWPTTSSSEPCGWPSWSPPAFSAATGSGPMEPPSIHGNADNTLCGASPARIRVPRRTSTSLHWRQGRQHPRRSRASVQSKRNWHRRGTAHLRQLRSKHWVPGDHARSKFVRTWGGGLRDKLVTLGTGRCDTKGERSSSGGHAG